LQVHETGTVTVTKKCDRSSLRMAYIFVIKKRLVRLIEHGVHVSVFDE